MARGLEQARLSRTNLSGLALLMALLSCPPPVLGQPGTPAPAPAPVSQTVPTPAPPRASDVAKGSTPIQPPVLLPVSNPPPLPAVEKLRLVAEPPGLSVGYKENQGKLSLSLTNQADVARKFIVKLSGLTLKTGNIVARAGFPDKAGRDWTEVEVLGKATSTLAVDIDGLTHLGTYEGVASVRTVEPTATETVSALLVVRQPPVLDVLFSGQDLANGVLTLKPKSGDERHFSFVIDNPKTAGEVVLKISVVPRNFNGQSSISIRPVPDLLRLLPGDSKVVRLDIGEPQRPFWSGIDGLLERAKAQPVAPVAAQPTDTPKVASPQPPAANPVDEDPLRSIPPTGDFFARLNFEDNSGAAKNIDVRLQPAFVPWWQWILIAFLVLIGALLSVLIGSAIPNIITSTKLKRQFGTMRNRLKDIPDAEQAKTAITRELKLADAAVRAAAWYTPSAADLLAEQAVKAIELEQRIQLLEEVAQLMRATQRTRTIMSSARTRLFAELEAVMGLVAKSGFAPAKARFDAALAAAESPLDAAAVLATIDSTIATLPKVAPSGANPALVNRLSALLEQRVALGTAVPSTDTLLEMDYQCQCAQLYFVRYLGMVRPNHVAAVAAAAAVATAERAAASLGMNNPSQNEDARAIAAAAADAERQAAANLATADLAAADAEVINLLCSGRPALIAAMTLVDSIEFGVTPSALRRATSNLKDTAFIVVSPDQPRQGQVAIFQLVFKNPALNKSPLLRDYLFRWSFDDGASEAQGPKVGHYIPETNTPSRDKSVQGVETRAKINFSVTVGLDEGAKLTGNRNTILPAGWKKKFPVQPEAVSFVVTLGGAVALALLTEFADAKPLESLRDFLNPFLIGFGSDRLKALVAARPLLPQMPAAPTAVPTAIPAFPATAPSPAASVPTK